MTVGVTVKFALNGGAVMVFLSGRFDPGEVLTLIQQEGVTVWGAVPTMASRVVEHPDIDDYDLSSVRSISMGGAPVQPRLLEEMRKRFPNAQRGLSTIYGMTETGSGVVYDGRPLDGVDVRIDDAGDVHFALAEFYELVRALVGGRLHDVLEMEEAEAIGVFLHRRDRIAAGRGHQIGYPVPAGERRIHPLDHRDPGALAAGHPLGGVGEPGTQPADQSCGAIRHAGALPNRQDRVEHLAE